MRIIQLLRQVFLRPLMGLRVLVLIAAALIITGWASVSLGQQYTQGLTQNTQYGQVKGTKDQPTGGLIWRGIKFARAPEGELRWKAPQGPESWSGVKEFIKVTVAGESAGAHDILALMAAKQAAGLFQKAIYQSGGMNYRDAASSREVAEGYVQNLKLSTQGGELAKALRTAKAEAILKAKPKNAAYDVIIDGQMFPASP